MDVTLTEAALNKLKKMKLREDQFPRIDANVIGGCGISVKFKLVFDELRRNDTVVEYEGIQIRLDYFTKRCLDEKSHIDYTEEHGFQVGESFASSACAIELRV